MSQQEYQQEKNLKLLEVVDLFKESEYSYFFDDVEDKTRNEKILKSLIEDMVVFVGSSLSFSEILEVLKKEGHYDFTRVEISFLNFSYLRIVDVEKVINRDDNACNVKGNSASWKDHMNKALAEEIAKKQTYTLGAENYYSPVHYDFFESKGISKKNVPTLIAAFNIKEDSWREFQGTYYYGDDEKIGVSADLIFDNNTHYHARVEESFAALINKITTE